MKIKDGIEVSTMNPMTIGTPQDQAYTRFDYSSVLKAEFMDYPLVSIGVPVFNGEKWVRRALDSLIRQDYHNIEIIVSDNASDDSTYEILCSEYINKYPCLKVIRQQNTISVVDNFKAVLSEAKGYYFMWAAIDDYWEPSYVSSLVAKMESDNTFAVAQSATAKVSEYNFDPIGFVRFNGIKNPEICSPLQLTKWLVSPHKYNFYIYGLFKRKLLKEAFKYVPNIASSDRWFLLQFPLAGYKFGYVDEPLYVRTIRKKPVYVRYKNDDYSKNVKRIEGKWFCFEAVPVVKKMLNDSSMVPNIPQYRLWAVLTQLIISRLKLGARLMTKSLMFKILPNNFAMYVLNKCRARRLRKL